MQTVEKCKFKILGQDIISKLKQAEKEIENGEGIEADIVLKELKQKYEYK